MYDVRYATATLLHAQLDIIQIERGRINRFEIKARGIYELRTWRKGCQVIFTS